MAKVFVSHASADHSLIQDFVDEVLRNGCGLSTDEIFYSSGSDTGVPDGSDLLGYVRSTVAATGLVITMLTPTFQTRPVCLAEMGAAWGTAGKLFPLLVPGMDRSSLEGVLSTSLVGYMDDPQTLDRLHDQLIALSTQKVSTGTWSRAKEKWIDRVTRAVNSGELPFPVTASIEELDELKRERDELIDQLEAAEGHVNRLKIDLEKVSALKNADEVMEAIQPSSSREHFEELLELAISRLDKIDNEWVRLAIVALSSNHGGLAAPSPWDAPDAWKAVKNGLLIDREDGYLYPDDTFPAHEQAHEAVVEALSAAEDCEASDEHFSSWFESQFGAKPNLGNPTVLNQLFIR